MTNSPFEPHGSDDGWSHGLDPIFADRLRSPETRTSDLSPEMARLLGDPAVKDVKVEEITIPTEESGQAD
jgi:hypothetical protein